MLIKLKILLYQVLETPLPPKPFRIWGFFASFVLFRFV